MSKFKRKKGIVSNSSNKISNHKRISHINPSLTTKTKNNNGNNNGNGKLTFNQKIFADQWLIDRNGTRAYKVAYPNTKNDNVAGVLAHGMLRKLKIKKYIDSKLEELGIKAEIDQEWVLKRYKKLTEYHISDFLDDEGNLKPLSEIPKDSLYAVCGFKNYKQFIKEGKDAVEKITKTLIQNLKFADKKGVLDSIGKYLGMFEKDNQQKRPLIPVQINVGLVD